MSNLAIIALSCGLGAAVAWGVADFLAAKTARFAGPVSGAVAVNIIGIVAFGLFYLATLPFSQHHLAVEGIWYLVGASIALALGQLTFFRALSIGPVSLVSPLASIYPLFITVGVIVLFNAQLSLQQGIGIGAVMVGALVAGEMLSIKKSERRVGPGPAFALTTALLWGIGYTFLSKALDYADWQTVSLVQLSIIAVVCTALAPAIKGTEKVFTTSNLRLFLNKFVLGAALLQTAGMVVLNIGLDQSLSLAPAATAVSACYPVLTILLALKHFKEDFKLLPLAGAAICIIGVIVLSLG